MAYVHREAKIVYLAHPRTASVAISTALVEHAGFEQVGDHFAGAPRTNGDGWTVWTSVRNHFDAIASWHCADHTLPVPATWASVEKLAERLFGRSCASCPLGHSLPSIHPPHVYYWHAELADWLIDVETLEEDLWPLLRRADLPVVPLERENESESREGRHYQDLFHPGGRAYVEGLFHVEMRELGYSW